MSASAPRPAALRAGIALAASVAAALVLVVTYLALGGGGYRPLEVADPCDPRPLTPAEGFEGLAQQVALSGLDGAACELRVTREDLALALAGAESRRRFAREHRIGDERLEAAVRSGLRRAVADAERTGAVSGIEASLLGAAVEGLPVGVLIDVVRGGIDLSDAIGGLPGP